MVIETPLKKCTCCNLEFPKTEAYFFKKIIKQQNKSGLAVYHSFRELCKKCKAEKEGARRIKKRCEEMGCDISEYRENWKKQYSNTRTLFKELIGSPIKNKSHVISKIKNGYVYTSYDQYKTDGRKNLSLVRRKYDYGDLDFVPKGTQTGITHLTDSYVALTLKAKVKDVPKEMIEFKRLTIQIKREIERLKNDLKQDNYGN